MPSTLAFLSLLSFFTCLGVGSFVYITSTRKTIHTTFMAMCLANAYIAFVQFMMLQSGDAQTALFWLKVNSFWSVAVVIALHFILIFIGKGAFFHRWWVWAILYGTVLLISVTALYSNIFNAAVVKAPWGYSLNQNTESPIGLIIYMPVMLIGIAAMVIAVSYYFHQKDPLLKRQAAFIAVGYFVPNAFGLISGVIPSFFEVQLPEMTAYGVAVQETLIGLAIWRYNLFELNPASAAKNIIATMSDMLIITDAKGDIMFFNKALVSKTGYESDALLKQPVSTIVAKDEVERFIEHSVNGKVAPKAEVSRDGSHSIGIGHYDSVFTTRDGRTVPVGVAVSQLTEKDGRPAGYVLIARDMTASKRAEQEKNELIEKLQSALANIKTLKGLVPICANCHKVRNDEGFWQQVEEYVAEHTEVDFSHGLCEQCAHELYSDFMNNTEEKDSRNS